MPFSSTSARLHLLPRIAGRFASPHYHRSSLSAQRPPSDHVRACVLNWHMLCCSKAMNPLSYVSPKAAVKPSPIHGRGLFAVEAISAGEIVCVKGGYIFKRQQLGDLNELLGPAEIQIAENLFIGPLNRESREGSMVFSNHSCDPNIAVQGQIVFVAMRDIAAGEELTHDWATTDDDTYEMECRCNAPNCR